MAFQRYEEKLNYLINIVGKIGQLFKKQEKNKLDSLYTYIRMNSKLIKYLSFFFFNEVMQVLGGNISEPDHDPKSRN